MKMWLVIGGKAIWLTDDPRAWAIWWGTVMSRWHYCRTIERLPY